MAAGAAQTTGRVNAGGGPGRALLQAEHGGSRLGATGPALAAVAAFGGEKPEHTPQEGTARFYFPRSGSLVENTAATEQVGHLLVGISVSLLYLNCLCDWIHYHTPVECCGTFPLDHVIDRMIC